MTLFPQFLDTPTPPPPPPCDIFYQPLLVKFPIKIVRCHFCYPLKQRPQTRGPREGRMRPAQTCFKTKSQKINVKNNDKREKTWKNCPKILPKPSFSQYFVLCA
jgi:hypothetical protein